MTGAPSGAGTRREPEHEAPAPDRCLADIGDGTTAPTTDRPREDLRASSEHAIAGDHAIGCALLDAPAAAVVAGVDPRDWPTRRHRDAAQAIAVIVADGGAPDPLLVAAELRRLGLEVDLAWMHACFVETPAISSVGRYCAVVREYARHARLVEKAAQLGAAALEHDERRIADAVTAIATEGEQ